MARKRKSLDRCWGCVVRVSLFGIMLALINMDLAGAEGVKPVTVKSMAALQKAVSKSQPGTVIVLADGQYDKTCKLSGKGSKRNPIVVRSQTLGGAEIKSPMSISGDYVTVMGFKFTDKGALSIQGRGCRLSRCHMSNVQSGKWVFVDAKSREVEIDHCLFEDKKINLTQEKGCQLIQFKVLNKKERHHIHHNHFRNLPKGQVNNGYETIQVITNGNPKDPKGGNCETVIEDNLFERCNGESEIISIKSNGNVIRRNTFRGCEGALVFRHGDKNHAVGNFFFGDGEAGSGGVRLQGSDQVVANNYFNGLGLAAIAMMDGTPDDLYIRVERAQILHNTIFNCHYGLEVGLNHSLHPNGTVPSKCLIGNNIIVANRNVEFQAIRLVQDDQPEDWTWTGNVVQGELGIPPVQGIAVQNAYLLLKETGLNIPSEKTPSAAPVTSRDDLKVDLLGTPRTGKYTIGAIQYSIASAASTMLSEKQVGPHAESLTARELK